MHGYLGSADEPHPQRKFSDAALQTQRCDRNTRWNNLRFLHRTATRSCQWILPYMVGGGAYARDKNTSAGLCAKNAGKAYDQGRGRICGTLRYRNPVIVKCTEDNTQEEVQSQKECNSITNGRSLLCQVGGALTKSVPTLTDTYLSYFLHTH